MTTIELLRPHGSAGHAPFRPPWRRVVAWTFTAFVAFLAWWALAPPQLAGGTTYVITRGISMLPHFRAGDVVILRAEPRYHVGEVAGYQNPELHVLVMHRIIAIKNGHFEFKGDNNSYPDSYKPTKSQIVGAEILHFDGAGKYLLTLRIPVVAAVLLGLLWLYTFSGPRRSRRHRRRRPHA